MSEYDENVTEAPKKKGPKPNPFLRLAKAQAKAAKARAAYAKVAKVAEALEAAEAEEQEALAALQEAVEEAGVSVTA